MERTQPNRTLINISDDIERLAEHANQLLSTLPPAEAAALSNELCAIHDLIEEATNRLRALQARYPDQF
jgi:hypothetical protein